jgi:hypothetical protein
MNIFYLSHDPERAASYMYNRHVVKMILESAQLLCTEHIEHGNANVPYKATHRNHPSAIWARSSASNYTWLYEHMIALGKEYTRRYGKRHLTIEKCYDVLATPPAAIAKIEFTEPPQCMPDEYKADDAVTGYWNYYIGEKHNVANSNEQIITKRVYE